MSLLTTANQVWQNDPSLAFLIHGLNSIFIFIKFIVALFGSIAILIGAVLAGFRYFLYQLCQSKRYTLDQIRLDLAQTMILSLEFFVASDVIETMIAPDFRSLGLLAILVAIRTFLNFAMQREISTLSQGKS